MADMKDIFPVIRALSPISQDSLLQYLPDDDSPSKMRIRKLEMLVENQQKEIKRNIIIRIGNRGWIQGDQERPRDKM